MMKKTVAASIMGYWPVSDRIIMVKLKGNPFNININPFNINIIQVYAPTTEHDDEEIEQFFDNIKKVMGYSKSGEINIIMGDWNAKVCDIYEYPVTGKFGLGERTERGESLINF